MDNFIFTVNAVVPLFMVMAFGYIVRQKGWLPESFREVFNRFCFDFALPCSLFRTAYNSNIGENFNPRLVAAMFAAILFELVLVWLVFPRFVGDRAMLGSMIQGTFRTNTIIFGITLGRNLFGEANLLPVAILIAVSVPTFNVIAVFVLSVYGGGNGDKITIGRLLKQILSNRLIVGTLAGLALSLMGVALPQIALSPINDLAAASSPLAMMALGAQFSFDSARKHLLHNSLTISFRLLIIPLVVVPTMCFLGFRGPELGALFIVFSSPTATSSYIMAKNMGCDGDLASEIVVFSTFFSVFTIFAGVYTLRSFGLI